MKLITIAVKDYQYIHDLRSMRIRIFRPDGISIEADERDLYFEMERRWGIQRASNLEINSATLKTMYRIILDMQQYIPFEEVTN